MDSYLRRLFDSELDSEGEVTICGVSLYPSNIIKEIDPTAYEHALPEWINERKSQNIDRANQLLKIEQDGYEEAAQFLYEELTPSGFLERVESCFDINDHSEINGVVNKIPSVFDSIITTNFDPIIKKCFEACNKAFDETLIGSDAEDIPRLLGQNKSILLYLHGRANSSTRRILTKTEYDKHYAGDSLINVYKALCYRSLLFLGCSLVSDRTLLTMEAILSENGHDRFPRHYAFLQLPSHSSEILQKSKFLAKSNIFPIWYDGEHDPDIEALLELMASDS